MKQHFILRKKIQHQIKIKRFLPYTIFSITNIISIKSYAKDEKKLPKYRVGNFYNNTIVVPYNFEGQKKIPAKNAPEFEDRIFWKISLETYSII